MSANEKQLTAEIREMLKEGYDYPTDFNQRPAPAGKCQHCKTMQVNPMYAPFCSPKCRDEAKKTTPYRPTLRRSSKTASHKDVHQVAFKVYGDEDENGVRMLLQYIADNAGGGHSFEVVVDPEDSERKKSFFMDGDGSFSLEDLKVELLDENEDLTEGLGDGSVGDDSRAADDGDKDGRAKDHDFR